jgi:dTDP-4-amino-4,6-dideoxygalactose transaminase
MAHQSELVRFIPLASPDINEGDIEHVARVLRTGMLVQGKEVELLEKAMANFVGVKEAICVSNGTATLHLALHSLGIGEGDEVIVPAFSYVATANVVELVKAKPVFVDIDPDTFNIDVNKIEAAITSKTRAIIPVHEFGLAANMTAITAIADRYGLFIIEDAACALGARFDGKYVGSFGSFGSFSLHPRKAISSGEGGILTTNDSKLAERVRILRNHGISYVDGAMDFVEAGFNYRMTDFQAALVNSQFSRLDRIISYKKALAEIYLTEIKNPLIKLPVVPNGQNHTWQTFHVLIDDKLDQKKVLQFLRDNNIGANYGAQCIPAQTFYRKKYSLDSEVLFPNAWRGFTKGIALPIYEKLQKEDIQYMASIVNKISDKL